MVRCCQEDEADEDSDCDSYSNEKMSGQRYSSVRVAYNRK